MPTKIAKNRQLLLIALLLSFGCLIAAKSTRHSSATTKTATASIKQSAYAEILTANELSAFKGSLLAIKDAKCRQDMNATLHGIQTGQHWAIAMYDATAKSAYGIENGMLHQFGHYDECLSQYHLQQQQQPVRRKYCLANVRLHGMSVLNVDSRKRLAINQINKNNNNNTNINTIAAPSILVHWGVCVPASCNGMDVAIYLQYILQRNATMMQPAASAPQQLRAATADEEWHMSCQLQAPPVQITTAMYAYALVIITFVCLAILSTCYHAYHVLVARQLQQQQELESSGVKKAATAAAPHRPTNEVLHMALLSFSIIENTKKLFQVSKDQLGLNAINGIKALAMIFILAGHALSFIYGGPVFNAEFISEHIKLPTFAFLSNSLLFVDIFLLLSGFLFCRILLIELERRRGRVNAGILYLGRYIRLTPAYMAIIGFYMTWFVHAGDGPMWRERIEREQQRCKASWWANVLYINNYVNTDKLCMFQSWYLAVDTQLFIIAPLFIFLLYKARRQWGVTVLGVAALVTAAVPFVVTYVRQLDPTLMVYADEITDLASNDFYIGSYIKTHIRASAYIMGLLVGYIVHVMQANGTKFSPWFVRIGWSSAVLVGVGSMFSICRFYAGEFSTLESTLYAGCHKLGWNLAVAWLVVAVTTGHAGWIQRFLSSHFFAPISRLTYCAYLSNGIVELYHAASVRSVAYMSYISLINEVLAHIFDTFLMAFVLCLLFESPIHALERILLRRQRSSRTDSARNQTPDTHTPSTSEERV